MARSAFHRSLQLAQWGIFLSIPTLIKPYWNDIVASLGGPKWANVFGVLGIHLVTLLVGNLYFLFLYRLRSPSIERYKVHSKEWPWLSNKPETVAEFKKLVWLGIGLTLLNNAISVPLAIVNYETSVSLGYSAALKDFPPTLTILGQLLAFTLIEDTMFYWSHRTLHHPKLYPYVHKLHHRFVHSVSIAAEATHPVEFVVGNVLPFATGPLLLGAHLVTLYMWTAYRIGETVTNHSGYDLPWSMYELLPFQGTATGHDLHHQHYTCNYGSMYAVWDWVMGTNVEAVPYLKDRVKKE